MKYHVRGNTIPIKSNHQVRRATGSRRIKISITRIMMKEEVFSMKIRVVS